MRKKPVLNIETIKRSGLEETLKKEIVDFKLLQSDSQHNSLTGIILLTFSDGDDRKIFFKNHFRQPTKDDPSGENLFSYHHREGTYLDGIHKINSTLVPELYGTLQDHSKNHYLLFTEHLDGPTSLDKHQEFSRRILSTNDNSEKLEIMAEKLTSLRMDLRQIAKFVGLCHANRNNFPNYLDGLMRGNYERRQVGQIMRLAHYLRRTVHFNEMGGREYFLNNKDKIRRRKLFEEGKVEKYIRQKKGVHHVYAIKEIFSYRKSVYPEISELQIKKKRIALQHGDCRLYHNFNGSFCDVEDFGYYPWHHDVVSFTSEEVVRPPVSELPGLLAYYLVFMNAYSSKSNVFTIQELEQIQELKEVSAHQELERKLSTKIKRDTFSDFVVGYLAGVFEDDIYINGVRKKYTRRKLQKLADQYPGHTVESLQDSKLSHVGDIYNFLTSVEAGDLFSHCNNRDQVVNYFFHWGNLLEKLGLIEVNDLGRLEKLSRDDHQWMIYFNHNKEQ